MLFKFSTEADKLWFVLSLLFLAWVKRAVLFNMLVQVIWNATGDGFGHNSFMRQGQKFTTIDSDNDDNSGVNCALHSQGANGGWWYRHCSYNSLTGMYFFVCSLLDIKYFIYASVQLTFVIIHEIIYEKINKTSRQLLPVFCFR